jgi:coenzyme PQQ synthesis protein D (PqqD)
MKYRVNTPHVIAETIGGETIIVHLSTGCYFNLGGTAVEIWEGIADERPTSSITTQLVLRYDASPGEVEAAFSRLLEELQREELIVAMDDDGVPVATEPAPEPAVARPPFVEPSVSKFTDMQDIILLDPVHEVDARGWPHTNPTSV